MRTVALAICSGFVRKRVEVHGRLDDGVVGQLVAWLAAAPAPGASVSEVFRRISMKNIIFG